MRPAYRPGGRYTAPRPRTHLRPRPDSQGLLSSLPGVTRPASVDRSDAARERPAARLLSCPNQAPEMCASRLRVPQAFRLSCVRTGFLRRLRANPLSLAACPESLPAANVSLRSLV